MAQLKKILLVDDDEDLREALSEQLIMTEDFDVFEAGNGAEAMTRAKEAIKLGLAMVIAYGIALGMGWLNPYWAAFAVAIEKIVKSYEYLGIFP